MLEILSIFILVVLVAHLVLQQTTSVVVVIMVEEIVINIQVAVVQLILELIQTHYMPGL